MELRLDEMVIIVHRRVPSMLIRETVFACKSSHAKSEAEQDEKNWRLTQVCWCCLCCLIPQTLILQVYALSQLLDTDANSDPVRNCWTWSRTSLKAHFPMQINFCDQTNVIWLLPRRHCPWMEMPLQNLANNTHGCRTLSWHHGYFFLLSCISVFIWRWELCKCHLTIGHFIFNA